MYYRVSSNHDQQQAKQLDMLVSLLERIKERPRMRQLAPTLIALGKSGQIACETHQLGGQVEVFFTVNVTRRQAARILKPVTDPIAWALLKSLFLRRVYIHGLKGQETDVAFSPSMHMDRGNRTDGTTLADAND
jgi:hypothetical protein